MGSVGICCLGIIPNFQCHGNMERKGGCTLTFLTTQPTEPWTTGDPEPGKTKSLLNWPHYDIFPQRKDNSPTPGTGVPGVTDLLIKLCWAAIADRFLSGGPPGAECEVRPGKAGPEGRGGRADTPLAAFTGAGGVWGTTLRWRSSDTQNITGFIRIKRNIWIYTF